MRRSRRESSGAPRTFDLVGWPGHCFPVAFTIAKTPARIAGGRSGHAATTAARSGSVDGFGVQLLALSLVVGETPSEVPCFVVVSARVVRLEG